MDLNKIIDIVNGKCINEFRNKKINKIVTDTRKLKKNDLFNFWLHFCSYNDTFIIIC